MPRNASIVIPLLNEEQSIPELISSLNSFILSQDSGAFEVILVDDGSQDKSWERIAELLPKKNFTAFKLKENYGKAIALQTGFNAAKHPIIATMDADLQDDPFELPKLFEEIENGADLVCAWREKRNDSTFKKLSSDIYNTFIGLFFMVRLKDINSGMKVFKRECLDGIELYSGLHRFIPVLMLRKQCRIKERAVLHYPRKYGKSHYGPDRVFEMLCDLIAISLFRRFKPNFINYLLTAVLLSPAYLLLSREIATAFVLALISSIYVIDKKGRMALKSSAVIDKLGV